MHWISCSFGTLLLINTSLGKPEIPNFWFWAHFLVLKLLAKGRCIFYLWSLNYLVKRGQEIQVAGIFMFQEFISNSFQKVTGTSVGISLPWVMSSSGPCSLRKMWRFLNVPRGGQQSWNICPVRSSWGLCACLVWRRLKGDLFTTS